MHRGYIKLWRRLKDSDIWTKEKFTRGQAWVDLLMLANHKDGFIRKRNIRVDLKRGDLGWSERELADRWKWSRDKVRRFLNELCSENESKLIPQTAPQNKNITSCYHVLNYSLYQDGQTTDYTTDNTTNRPQTDRKQDQNKNVKNEKNIKKACAWPKDFSLTPEKREYAIKNGIDPKKVDAFFIDFRDWAAAKGATYKDWDAAFRTRVGKAPVYGKQFIASNAVEPEKDIIKTGSELAAERFKKWQHKNKLNG